MKLLIFIFACFLEEEGISEKDYRDSNVPYPRISGARFCGRGQLVCFGWTYTQQGPTKKTPRAYSSISGNAAAVGSSRPYSLSMPPTMIKVTDPPKHRTQHQSPRKGPSTKPKMVRIATQASWRQNSTTSESDQTTTDGYFIVQWAKISKMVIIFENAHSTLVFLNF